MELDPSIVQQVDDQRHYIDEQGNLLGVLVTG
jgi:hypothetical protein